MLTTNVYILDTFWVSESLTYIYPFSVKIVQHRAFISLLFAIIRESRKNISENRCYCTHSSLEEISIELRTHRKTVLCFCCARYTQSSNVSRIAWHTQTKSLIDARFIQFLRHILLYAYFSHVFKLNFRPSTRVRSSFSKRTIKGRGDSRFRWNLD